MKMHDGRWVRMADVETEEQRVVVCGMVWGLMFGIIDTGEINHKIKTTKPCLGQCW